MTNKNTSRYLLYFTFAVALILFGIKDRASERACPDGIQWSEDRARDEKRAVNDWFFRQRAYPIGMPDKVAQQRAMEFRKYARRGVRRSAEQWQFRGPVNIGGRVTDVEMPPTSMTEIYAATASGGVFKSEDRGESWRPVFDEALSLAVGDLAISPSNEDIIYAGTGEPNAGGGSLAYDGSGVYRSTDRGESWTQLALVDVGSVGRIGVHPTNPDICYVAAMGDLFENGENRGVFKTIDGGQSWEKVLFINDSTGVIDLAVHPLHPDTLYAASWERVRRPDRLRYGGAGSGIYRSYNGGESWQELTNGLPELPEDKGRIGLAIAASRPDYVYAIYADMRGFLQGIYRTRDGGDNWAALNPEGFINVSYMWWFGRIFVDPTNPNTVYATGLNMRKSGDGGYHWGSTFAGAHVDPHGLYIHPQDPDLVILGNDGGVYISDDGGDSYEFVDKLPITQFYTCELDYSAPERLYGGTQDNGTNRTRTGSEDDWQEILGADGFVVLVDPSNSNRIYAEIQYGGLYRSIDGGHNFVSATDGIAAPDRRNWKTPVVLDPMDPSILYYGTYRLYRSTDHAQTWTPVSPDLSRGLPSGNLAYGTITTISVSPLDGRFIWAGTDDGRVHLTVDGGENWEMVSSGLPDRWVTSIAADPSDPFTAYVTFSGYRWNSDITHIYKTLDLGQNWESIPGNLPDVPVNELIVNPDNGDLYIATDIGVFKSLNGGAEWTMFGEGLPHVVVSDLRLHDEEDFLLAATYGRGLYSIPVDDGASIVGDPAAPDPPFTVFPNPFEDELNIARNTPANCRSAEVVVYDVNGRLLLRKKLSSEGVSINTSSFQPGLYLVSTRCGTLANTFVNKAIKK